MPATTAACSPSWSWIAASPSPRSPRRCASPARASPTGRAFAACPDPAALQDRYGIGRPSAWTEDLEQLLLASLDQRPDELGYAAVNWTVPLLREHLFGCTGRWLSDDTIRRELDRLGYVWKRFRYVLPPDPEREKKPRHPPAAAGAAAA